MNSIDAILEEKADKDAGGFAKTFPDAWRPSLCGAATRRKASTSLQVSDVLGKTLVDWERGNFHCELIQRPESP